MTTMKLASPRRQISIRTQLLLAMGFILALALVAALVAFANLSNLQANLQRTLQTIYGISELSLSAQSNFLLARQNETSFLASWRSVGFQSAEMFVKAVEEYLQQANSDLLTLEAQIQSASDPELSALGEQIDQLKPLLVSYQIAFQATVNNIRERGRPQGLEDTLNTEWATLRSAVEPLQNPKFYFLLLEMRFNEKAYISNLSQEYIDNLKISSGTLIDLLGQSTPEDLTTAEGIALDAEELIQHAQTYIDSFNQLVALEQSAAINATVFFDTTKDINAITKTIEEKTSSGIDRANARLAALTRQSTLTLLFTEGMALGLGILVAVILAQRISNSLNQLSLVAQHMGQGDLSQAVTVTGSREVVSLAETFNAMGTQLRQILENLEQIVAERTQALEKRSTQLRAAAEIARDASSIRQLDVLLNRAVNLIRERFDFYYASIFLLDKPGEYAILQAATGDAGRMMLEGGHRLKIGETGMVGYVASSGEPRIALDVGTDAVHFRNPYLPDTHSELAIPLKVGQQVIGVIDVQSTQSAAFTEEDVTVLRIMADQLAVAIDNTRLLQDAQDSLKQVQLFYESYGQKAWEDLLQSTPFIGYLYDRSGAAPLYATPPKGKKRVDTIPIPAVSIPIKVRNQEIATLEVWPERQGWSEENETLLKALSDRLSQAMERTRLFEEAKTRAAREQTLNQLVTRFTRSLDLDTLLQTAVRELGQIPNISEVSIHIGASEEAQPAESGNLPARPPTQDS
jgi:GAF domain-containing protein/HAMP domain-containing protein